MPMRKELYPSDWTRIAYQLKTAADWHCTECGRPCRRPGESEPELFDRLPEHWKDHWQLSFYDDELGSVTIEKPGRFILTVAHLNHRPWDCSPGNLKALCTVCHLRYDSTSNARRQKLHVDAETKGQLCLPI